MTLDQMSTDKLIVNKVAVEKIPVDYGVNFEVVCLNVGVLLYWSVYANIL